MKINIGNTLLYKTLVAFQFDELKKYLNQNSPYMHCYVASFLQIALRNSLHFFSQYYRIKKQSNCIASYINPFR